MSSSIPRSSESISDSKDRNEQTPREQTTEQSEKVGQAVPTKGRDTEAERGGDEGAEGEEEGECGFCLFMKGGGCKDTFIAWEKCVEEADETNEDVVEKCFQVTSNLKKCMEAHSDYYEPVLRAEKAAEEQVNKEFHSEEKIANSDSTASPEISEKQVKS